MSNEYRDWLIDKTWEEGSCATAKKIYNYAEKVFLGQEPENVSFRYHWGSKGAEQKVLNYIYENFIEPFE